MELNEFNAICAQIQQPKYIYAFKYKKLGVYSQIVLADEDPKRRESVIKRGLAMDPKLYDGVKGTEYYCLGVYDDEKGLIVNFKQFILDCDEIYERTVDILGLKKEGEDHVGSEKEA